MFMIEEWRPVVGYEGFYEVSNLGRVKSVDRLCNSSKRTSQRMKGRVLKPRINTHRQNRCTVVLNKEGNATYAYISRLVLMAFVGPPPEKHDAAHWDGNTMNNRLDNLRWATVSQNMQDKNRHGTAPRGSHNAMSKLTEEQVAHIRASYRRNSYHDSNALELACQFNVSRGVILQIIKQTAWRHVD